MAAIVKKDTVRGNFETGDKPTSVQFDEWITSCVFEGGNGASVVTGAVAIGPGAVAVNEGQFTRASGIFSTVGDAQISSFISRNETTTNVQTELFLDGASGRLVIPDQTTWTFDIIISARRTDVDDESAGYKLEGVIDRNTGVATTALVGTLLKTVIGEDTAAWDVTAEADAANGALVIKVTGENAKTIRWVAKTSVVEVSG